jgi:hypothetical protein
MSGHHAHRGLPSRRSGRPVITAATAAIILLTAGACTSLPGTSTPAPAVAVASNGPAGHKPTLAGAGSTFDAPFFSVAFARYQQQHPGVTIGYSPVRGFEPLTCRLQEVRPRAPVAPAAPMAQVNAPTALVALGLSWVPVHEPVHDRGPYISSSYYCA